MALIYTIEVTSTCPGWSEVCSTAERLARDAAELAAVRGMAAWGVVCPAPVELGITLASAVEQGVRHLLGFDPLTQAEAVRMESLETSILAELGVPDPYGDTMSLIEPEPVEP